MYIHCAQAEWVPSLYQLYRPNLPSDWTAPSGDDSRDDNPQQTKHPSKHLLPRKPPLGFSLQQNGDLARILWLDSCDVRALTLFVNRKVSWKRCLENNGVLGSEWISIWWHVIETIGSLRLSSRVNSVTRWRSADAGGNGRSPTEVCVLWKVFL